MSKRNLTPVPHSRRTEPTVPVTNWNFAYSRGADVQTTWRRFGWTPPSEAHAGVFDSQQKTLQTSQL